MKPNLFHSFAALILIASLLSACAPDKPSGTPQPAGIAADVGGWKNATVTMKGYSINIDVSGGLKSSGWQVTVLTARPGNGGIWVEMEIVNNSSDPGALDLTKGPTVVDQQGNEYLPVMVDLGMSDTIPVSSSGNISASVQCNSSAPDKNGVQQANCDMTVMVSDSKALLSVGAGKTANVSIFFSTPPEASSLVMEWPDGTEFTVP